MKFVRKMKVDVVLSLVIEFVIWNRLHNKTTRLDVLSCLLQLCTKLLNNNKKLGTVTETRKCLQIKRSLCMHYALHKLTVS